MNVDGVTKGVCGVNPLMPARLFIWMLLYFAVKLTKLVVRAIDRLEWYQLDRIGGEIGSVALVFSLGSAVFNVVRGTEF